MNLKNLSVKNKTRSQILEYLNKKKISRIYKKFAASLQVEENLAVAVSGGPDSLALAYLAKCYAIKKNIKIYYFIVDHRLRSESSLEATNIKFFLKSIDINCEILKWNGKKPTKNIQAIARNKRYSLLINQCKKKDIKHLLLGHHLNDVLENFLIRIVRGSGLNGLISFNKISKYRDQNINILRPLLDIEKKDLYFCNTHPHQIYIEMLAEHGIIGSIFIFFIFYKIVFSKIFIVFKERNYVQIGSLIYLIFTFTPLLPSGAFFSDYMLNLLMINIAIFYCSNEKLNIFYSKKL